MKQLSYLMWYGSFIFNKKEKQIKGLTNTVFHYIILT